MSINSLSSDQLLILGSLLSIALSDDLGADDLNILGNFIVSIGSLILTKAAQIQSQTNKATIG